MNDNSPQRSATPPWSVSDSVPPPPPPPPPAHYAVGTPMWQPAPVWHPEPTPPSRRRRALGGGLALIFAAGISAGVVAGRLTGTSPATAVTPATPTTAAGRSGAGAGVGSGTGPSGATGSSGTADTAAIAAKVTPGIVNVNITLSGGSAAGTGMVITTTGQVLTNNHVIDGETSVSVELPSTGRTYTAQVIGYDVADDVALLQIQGGGSFSTVSIGNSSSVTVGQTVVALGNAQGRNTVPTVTSGSVTALNQSVTATDQGGGAAEHITGMIQVDAPIQPGDSGGPLVDTSATVVAMDTAAQVSTSGFNPQASTAYAIPINRAIAIVKQIQSGRSTATVHVGNTRALIGIGVTDSASGVQVSTVEAGSAAAQAGIAVGAVITSVAGTAIDSNTTLRGVLVAHRPGDSVVIAWTDATGSAHTATVTLGSGPPA